VFSSSLMHQLAGNNCVWGMNVLHFAASLKGTASYGCCQLVCVVPGGDIWAMVEHSTIVGQDGRPVASRSHTKKLVFCEP